MFKKNSLLVIGAALALSAATFIACSDDTGSASTSGGSPLNPGDGGTSGAVDAASDGSTASDGGTCTNKPAGCFCGTPTTQVQFLNRCTNATALPVNLAVKPATTSDIP
ncbi:MAG: hypothetical protein JWP97_4243 [Labilithrix sp.]|nr:hypothetical protein [Labilithrix sp.]